FRSVIPLWRRAQEQGHSITVRELPGIYWRDVGTISELAQLYFDVLNGAVSMDMPEGVTLDIKRKAAYPNDFSGKALENIGEYVWIDPGVEATVSMISTFKRSIVLAGPVRPNQKAHFENCFLTPWGEILIK
ncbi:MAG: hypothetical protein PHC61_08835, partial [Chitinivibrionales bacterium]|nr:hypothetical protein [Chitinivibrionales bacterium]